MVKTLNKKFIVTAMTAISILLILLIGAINIINLIKLNNTSWNSLDQISRISETTKQAPEGIPEKPEIPPGKTPPENNERNEYDTYMASNFFFVEYDKDGNVIKVDASRTSMISEDDAIEMADAALEKGEQRGESDSCIYQIQSNDPSGEYSVVFLDTSNNKRMALSILGISLLVGLACWLLMLLIILLLSKRAIKPIAENIEMQKQFITNAGHELKTPLAIIQSNADAMELYNGESKWSSNIKTQVERLSKLTNDLLSLARMEESTNKLHMERVDISEELEIISAGFEESCEMKSMKLSADIEKDIHINCCKADIEKLFGLLIDNAVKYGKEQSEISIKLHKQARGVLFSIENECSELPQVAPDKLFERFYRSDTARTQEGGGAGIGLSMAKSIVEAHRGSIKAEYIKNNSIQFTVEL